MPMVIARGNPYTRKSMNVLFESKISSRITSSQILEYEEQENKENMQNNIQETVKDLFKDFDKEAINS